MEFTYRVSENDYLRAWRLAAKQRRGTTTKTIAFWVFIVICLTLLFGVVRQRSQQETPPVQEQSEPVTIQQPTPTPTALLVQVGPLIGFLGLWGALIFVGIPYLVKRQYRRDTNLHGEITMTLDPQTISIDSTTGSKFQAGWNVYKEWCEKGDIVLLRYPSGIFTVVNTVSLDGAQRAELRGILTTALPKKK